MAAGRRTRKFWPYVGAVLGGAVSIAANVAHSYVPPAGVSQSWHPQSGAVLGSVFWPVALFVGVEILTRTTWPDARRWVALRFGGLLPVAVVAAVVSYRHLSALLKFYGEDWLTVAIGPLAVDGLMVMATGALLAASVRTAGMRRPAVETRRVELDATGQPSPANRGDRADGVDGEGQGWFWTPEWQAGEQQASAEIAAGQTKSYDSMDALFADVADGADGDASSAAEGDASGRAGRDASIAPAKTPDRLASSTARKPSRRAGTAVAVTRLRSKHPEMPVAEIARRVGVSDRTVRRHLNPPTGPSEQPVTEPAAA